jgi:hypothetical protein
VVVVFVAVQFGIGYEAIENQQQYQRKILRSSYLDYLYDSKKA